MTTATPIDQQDNITGIPNGGTLFCDIVSGRKGDPVRHEHRTEKQSRKILRVSQKRAGNARHQPVHRLEQGAGRDPHQCGSFPVWDRCARSFPVGTTRREMVSVQIEGHRAACQAGRQSTSRQVTSPFPQNKAVKLESLGCKTGRVPSLSLEPPEPSSGGFQPLNLHAPLCVSLEMLSAFDSETPSTNRGRL